MQILYFKDFTHSNAKLKVSIQFSETLDILKMPILCHDDKNNANVLDSHTCYILLLSLFRIFSWPVTIHVQDEVAKNWLSVVAQSFLYCMICLSYRLLNHKSQIWLTLICFCSACLSSWYHISFWVFCSKNTAEMHQEKNWYQTTSSGHLCLVL